MTPENETPNGKPAPMTELQKREGFGELEQYTRNEIGANEETLFLYSAKNGPTLMNISEVFAVCGEHILRAPRAGAYYLLNKYYNDAQELLGRATVEVEARQERDVARSRGAAVLRKIALDRESQ